MDQRADTAGAHAGIVPAIKQAVRAVPLGVIEPAPHLAVLASRRRVAGVHTSRPGAVTCLQV